MIDRSPVVAALLARHEQCPVCQEWTTEPPMTSRCRRHHRSPLGSREPVQGVLF